MLRSAGTARTPIRGYVDLEGRYVAGFRAGDFSIRGYRRNRSGTCRPAGSHSGGRANSELFREL
jgi:hypothetical protein